MPLATGRNRQGCPQATLFAVNQLNPSTQPRRDGVDDGQAQPRALRVASAVKPFEQACPILLIDPRPLIFNAQMIKAVGLGQLHGDHAMLRGEVGGVGDQVVQGDVDGGGIGDGIEGLVADVEGQFQVFAQQPRGELHQTVAHGFAQVDALRGGSADLGFEAGHGQ